MATVVVEQQSALHAGHGPGFTFRSEQHRHQGRVEGCRYHADRLQEPALGRAQTAQAGIDRILDRHRHCVISVLQRGNHLGHEERIARGNGQQSVEIDPVGMRDVGDPVPGQRLQSNAMDLRRRQVADDLVKWMLGADLVVAETQHHQCWRERDSTTQKLEQVQCRAVGPMHVLDNQHQRPRTFVQRGQDGMEDVRRRCVAAQQGRDRLAQHRNHFVDRTQRPGREQCLATAPCDIGLVADAGPERFQQTGFSDTGLTCHQRHGAVSAAQCGHQLMQAGERCVAFDQCAHHVVGDSPYGPQPPLSRLASGWTRLRTRSVENRVSATEKWVVATMCRHGRKTIISSMLEARPGHGHGQHTQWTALPHDPMPALIGAALAPARPGTAMRPSQRAFPRETARCAQVFERTSDSGAIGHGHVGRSKSRITFLEASTSINQEFLSCPE